MRVLQKICVIAGILATVCAISESGFSATKKSSSAAKKQSALQGGTKVRAKTEAKGLYNQDCYDAYYGCMDQFCIADNENGGSCMCSDEAAKYDEQLEAIKNTLAKAEKIRTEEVEKVEAGANADIIFNGTREYNDDGTVVDLGETKKKSTSLKSSWVSLYEEEEEEEYEEDEWENIDLSDKVGKDLYESANKLCKSQMAESCAKDMGMLTQMYSRQIISDCKGLENSILQKKSEADAALASANAAVRAALKESLEESNKYDRGTCMVEYKKCMQTDDACGKNWQDCVSEVAANSMVGKSSTEAKVTSYSANTYGLKAATLERLEAKKFICEKVLNSCVAVRDLIWDDFLRDAASVLKVAESNIESNKRQSCLKDITTCIQKACKDDIAGKGVETMDSCLASPDLARSFCKVQLEPCEAMEPKIWDYVKSKLAALRVDACTNEVKECFTDESRCGEDFVNCIGMDYKYIHDICPIDKLVVCKQEDPDFNMSKLDEMLMGLYLNIDNKALDNCQNLADDKMTELCGSTTDCNSFASDAVLGTGSLKSQKDNTVYRVTGMISFGSIKMGDATGGVTDGGEVLRPGEIGVKDYIAEIKKKNKSIENADAIISSIEEELNNIAGTINRAISLIESDQKIQYCITGRDLSQINGKVDQKGKGDQTAGRFPNLLNQYRVMIGMAALRQAQNNYNKALTEKIEQATKDASADVAEFMCHKIGDMGNTEYDLNKLSQQTPLTTPFSISYDVGSGLTTEALMSGGRGSISKDGGTSEYRGRTTQNSGVFISREATFNRDSRICHVCTTTTTKSCENVTKYFKSESKCSTSTGEPVCEDLKL